MRPNGGLPTFAAAQHRSWQICQSRHTAVRASARRFIFERSGKLTRGSLPFNVGDAQEADVMLPDDFPRF